MEKTITITKEEYDRLKGDSEWLLCLESAGIDSWSGIEVALDMLD